MMVGGNNYFILPSVPLDYVYTHIFGQTACYSPEA
jgi:hypothetical protein